MNSCKNVALLICCWSLVSFSALAQPSEGLRLFNQATQLFKAGKYDQAIPLYEQSYSLRQHKYVLYALAEAHRRLGHNRKSYAFYAKYAESLPEQERRPFLVKLDRTLRGVPSTLSVLSSPVGAKVLIDGDERGQVPAKGALTLSVTAGRHSVSVEAQAHRADERKILAEFGEPVSLNVKLQRLPVVVRHRALPIHRSSHSSRSSGGPFVRIAAGPTFPSFGDAGLDAGPALESGIAAGYLWRWGRFGISGLLCGRLLPVADTVVDDTALFATLLAGGEARLFLSQRLSVGLQLGVGALIVIDAAREGFLLQRSGGGSESYAGLALQPALRVTWRVWRGLTIDLQPIAATFAPRIGGLDQLAPAIERLLLIQISVGVGWQL